MFEGAGAGGVGGVEEEEVGVLELGGAAVGFDFSGEDGGGAAGEGAFAPGGLVGFCVEKGGFDEFVGGLDGDGVDGGGFFGVDGGGVDDFADAGYYVAVVCLVEEGGVVVGGVGAGVVGEEFFGGGVAEGGANSFGFFFGEEVCEFAVVFPVEHGYSTPISARDPRFWVR